MADNNEVATSTTQAEPKKARKGKGPKRRGRQKQSGSRKDGARGAAARVPFRAGPIFDLHILGATSRSS
jgi:hypothetical protein